MASEGAVAMAVAHLTRREALRVAKEVTEAAGTAIADRGRSGSAFPENSQFGLCEHCVRSSNLRCR